MLSNQVLALISLIDIVVSGKRSTYHRKLLKEAGLKVVYHLMPGLPGMNPEKDLRDFKRLFEEQEFQPDMLKLYPTLLVKGSALARDPGDFVPYNTETAASLIADLKEIVPPYVRIQRIQRDIPKPQIIAGVMNSNLRQYARRELKIRGKKCSCINCRELWRQLKTLKLWYIWPTISCTQPQEIVVDQLS